MTNVTVVQGPNPVKAGFAGDGYYLPSADTSKSVIVFAFPSRGIFVLGDRTSQVADRTFWGAQWAGQNILSGGSAPSAFKGFADTLCSKPPVCGGRWTSSPGNSSSPVDSIPAYMGTVVSSGVTKNGTTISGNITKIVVVVTAPATQPTQVTRHRNDHRHLLLTDYPEGGRHPGALPPLSPRLELPSRRRGLRPPTTCSHPVDRRYRERSAFPRAALVRRRAAA